MARMKKISKKKLKEPDEFISFTERAFLWVTKHSKKIVLGGIIVFVIALSVFVFQKWEASKEEEAHRKFSSAMEMLRMASSPYQEESTSVYQNLSERFAEIIKKFPRTSSGRLSLLYKGNVQLRIGEFEEAAKSYEAFLRKGPKERLYRAFALEGLAYSYEGKREYEKALENYQKIVEGGETFQLPNAYLGLGRCYEKLNKKKEALENYRAFLKLSQKSSMTNAVLRKISILENMTGQ
ncbi:MAG: tetratricopeptide repeat protein [Syntrophaceae bacterium]|nr:tetratricopeptide repeat protein [Syntrophaceae bacterium]